MAAFWPLIDRFEEVLDSRLRQSIAYYDPTKYQLINQRGFSGDLVPIVESTTPVVGQTGNVGSSGGSTPLPVPPDQVSAVTGIDPNEVAAATYGKFIPIWVGGMPRLGGHIIFGPTFKTISGIVYASFGVSFGMPAVNIGVRELREIRLDGYKVWTLAEGALMTGLTFRFYPGDELQAVDPLVSAAYPSAPVAHKGHCCLFIEDLALTNFDLKVPFPSAVIAETFAWTFDDDGAVTLDPVDPEDGVGLGYALEAIAYSPYVNLAADGYFYGHRDRADFITEGISERVDAVIVAENISFLELLVRFARLHLWDIVQRDKLMAIERGSVDPDIDLDLSDILSSGDDAPIVIERAAMSDSPRELEYSWIDISRDYEINSVTAKQMSVPAPSTRSEGKATVSLPVVHTIQEAMSWVTLRVFKDDLARETISFTTSISGYAIEPGDIARVDAGFKTYIIRVLECLKGANWTNKITGEPVLRCAPPLTFELEPGNPPTLYLWLKGDELSGSEGANIGTWPDESGNSFDFTQATEGDKPSLDVDGLNDLNVVHFDGSNNENMDGPDLSGPTAGSLFYVIRSAEDPDSSIRNGGTYLGTSAAGPHFPFSDGHIYTTDLRATRVDVGDPTPLLTQWNIISIISATSDYRYYINGDLLFSTTSNACVWPTGPELGAIGTLFATWTGDIAEVIGFNEAMAQLNRQQIEGYLAHKWGLTDNLDPSHPYKSTPP